MLKQANELEQVVLAPDQGSSLDRVREISPERVISFRTWLRLKVAWVTHGFGTHTWAAMKLYNSDLDRIIETGFEVCLFCPRTRPKHEAQG